MNQLGLPLALNTKMLWRNFSGDKNQQIIEFLANLLLQLFMSMGASRVEKPIYCKVVLLKR